MDATVVSIENSYRERNHREHRVISRSLQKLLIPGPDFRLTTANDSERGEVEAFIAKKFRDHHNARISTFLPALLSIHCGGAYTAALGLNPATQGAMFLEQYLDQPAEQVIAALSHQPISRNSIVEVGNLVSSLNGATALLYLMLLAVVQRSGFQWVIFTATPEVQRSIEKIGFKIASICEANPERLNTDSRQWGSYYDAKPWVTLGYVSESLQSCHQNLMLESVLSLTAPAIAKLADKLASL
ncbi:MAG: thermostable hemolysin [Porticoccaceae bacterium]|nr:thermostable hemolysin [Porticoccaceae bacterium]